MRFAIPLCGSFLLWREPLCRKTIFQAPKKCFFRTCLDCFQPLQNQYVGRHGDLKHCFPSNLKKTEALRKNKFSSSEKLFYSHMFGLLPILANWHIARPAGIRTSDLQGWSPTRWPLRYRSLAKKKIFRFWFFHPNLMKFRQAWLCQKKQVLKKSFFRTALMKLRWARLCKKQFSGSKKSFFRMPLVHLVTSFKLAPNCADACNT